VSEKEGKEPQKLLGNQIPFEDWAFNPDSLLEEVVKINSVNFAGNLGLLWGSVKL